jgi:ABC-type dipeptide/oligopeptide/nickel transport system permease subunit
VDLLVGIDPRIRVGVTGREPTLKARSCRPSRRRPRHATWRRVWRLKWGVGAALIMLAIGAVTALAPWVAPHDPLAVDIRHRLAPPAWMAGGTADHLLGTDQIGRDLLSRVIYGGRVYLVIGEAAVLISPPSASRWAWPPLLRGGD